MNDHRPLKPFYTTLPADTHIVVGMSGGVDSSVTALLLKEQGYQVTGMFMKNWEEDDTAEYCAAATDMADAKKVCEILDIPFHEVNFAHEYWENVFEHFLSEYAAGRTPNPDILCNKEIKFKEFLLQAESLGADYIATGHYVANGQDSSGGHLLLKGADQNKDQSYFLYTLNQAQLSKSLFPLGDIEKDLVRQKALDAGFPIHDKKDSTGICFIGERRFKDFLSQYLKPNPGDIRSIDGEILGRHDGLMYHTIGQRKGLGIGGSSADDDSGEAWYTAKKYIDTNTLIVVQGHDHPALMTHTLLAENCDWVSGKFPELGKQYRAKTRYRQSDQACQITSIDGDQFTVTFTDQQRAITPGQALVIYDDDICLGGATIISSS